MKFIKIIIISLFLFTNSSSVYSEEVTLSKEIVGTWVDNSSDVKSINSMEFFEDGTVSFMYKNELFDLVEKAGGVMKYEVDESVTPVALDIIVSKNKIHLKIPFIIEYNEDKDELKISASLSASGDLSLERLESFKSSQNKFISVLNRI